MCHCPLGCRDLTSGRQISVGGSVPQEVSGRGSGGAIYGVKDNAHSPVISLGSDGVRVGAVVHITPAVPIRSNTTQVVPVSSGSRMKKGRKQVVPDYVPASRQPRILRLASTTNVGGGSGPDAPDVNIQELGESGIQIGGNASGHEHVYDV